jgi:uncharacterized protein (DUF1800 family)
MERKEFFKTAVGKKRSFSTKLFYGISPSTGLDEYTGQWTRNEVAHLLKRTMFGATKQDIDYFLTMSMSEAVDELLNNIRTVSPPVRDYGLIEDQEGVFYDDLGVAKGDTWINDPNTKSASQILSAINQLRTNSLMKWWAGLIINQQRSIEEKMVLFWHHHYSVQQENVGDSQILYHHHKLLRDNVLGNVKDLTRNVAIDPAMLLHLNGFLNSKQAPDENFARELQELFTIGRGSGSGFTEEDVITAARVLTGWRYDTIPVVSTRFDSGEHDSGSKQFSAFYSNTVISGNSDGYSELDALINMIYATDESCKFICRKLYKWFVYYDIDDNVEANIITPLATILRNNNFEIKPVLLTLFKSEHFFDPDNQSCYIKAPFDFLAGTMRELNVTYPDYTDYVNGYPLFDKIYQAGAIMQQELFQPPDVSGYAAYVQDPMNYELWVNSNSLPARANFSNGLISDSLIDTVAFARNSADPSDPDQLVTDMTTMMLRYPLSDTSKDYVKNNFLLNKTSDNSVWTNAWNTNNTTVIVPALNQLFQFIMNLPEYHLC